MKKTKLALSLFGALFCLSMVQCGSNVDENGNPIYEYIPAKADKGDDWGMINQKGEFLFEDEFENTPSGVVNGFFSVKEEEGIAVYKIGEKPELVRGLEGLKAAGVMMDGKMPIVRKNERIKFVNKNGEELFELTPINKQEVVACQSFPIDGMMRFRLANGKCGFLSSNGKIAIEPKYDNVTEFMNGYAFVCNVKENSDGEKVERWSLIDKKGNVLFNVKETMDIEAFSHGMTIVEREDKYYVLDKKGETICKLPSKVQGISSFDGKYIIFYDEDHQRGVMNLDGEVIIKPKFRSLKKAGDNFVCIKDTDKGDAVIINTKGEEVGRIDDATSVTYIQGFGIFAEIDKECILFDLKGNEKENATFYDIDAHCADIITSDYFNAGEVASIACKGVISGDGFANLGIKPGAPASQVKLVTDANLSDLTYKNSLSVGEDIEGVGYTISKSVLFTNDIVETYYDSTPGPNDTPSTGNYYYTPQYRHERINPNARVQAYGANVSLDNSEKAKDVYEACVANMKKAGFKQKSAEENTTMFEGKSADIIYAVELSGSDVTVVCTYFSFSAFEAEPDSDEAEALEAYY